MPVTNGPGTEAPAIEADPAAGESYAGQRHPRPFRGILRDLLRPLRIWTGALQLWRALASLTLALSGLVAAVVIATLMVQGLTRHTVAVLPIAVPKELADKGFVPEVAASRLRDAMNAVAERSQAPKGPEIALRSDVPDIVVPTVGISIDSIVTAIRGFLHRNRRRTISGEFTVADGQLWLRLRLDGGQIYSSLSGGALERPDELLVAAAPHIYHEIDPFVAASYLFAYKDDAAQALMILDTLSENKTTSDRNPADPYVVKAWIYIDRRNYPEAMAMAEQAIRLEPRYAPSHTVRGNVLKAQRRYDEALAEYREALQLDPETPRRRSIPPESFGARKSMRGPRNISCADSQVSRASGLPRIARRAPARSARSARCRCRI